MRIILTICLLCTFFFANATHWIAGNIEVTHIDANSYKVRLYFYRDCGGVNAPSSVSVTAISSCTGVLNLTLNRILIDTANQLDHLFISNLCDEWSQCSECLLGSPNPTCPVLLQGVSMYIYETTVTLPPCDDWVLSYGSCCRNNCTGKISNAANCNTAADSWYVYASMDNLNFPGNSMPRFQEDIPAFVCENFEWNYSFNAIDPDGDSLVYTLVTPLEDAGLPIQILPAFTPEEFMLTKSGIFFDSLTGDIICTPSDDSSWNSTDQMIFLAVRIDQYDSLGNFIGSMIRDIQLNTVERCDPINAFMASQGIVEMEGGDYVTADSNQTTIYTCSGDSLDFTIAFADTTYASAFKITTNFTSQLPGATLDTAGITIPGVGYSMVGNFKYTSSNAEEGTYSFTVNVSNDGCPVKISNDYFFNLEVHPKTIASNDTIFCSSGDSVQLLVEGGTQFLWEAIYGNMDLSCVDCPNPLSAPDSNHIYVVSSDVGLFGCIDRDTVEVLVVPPIELIDTCFSQLVTLDAAWKWDDGDTSKNISYKWNNDITANEDSLHLFRTGEYYIVATDSAVIYGDSGLICQIRDTVDIGEICPFMIPNVITPNGDGFNDCFEIEGAGGFTWDVKIFNRWGVVVYENREYDNSFCGGKLSDGVYNYEINTIIEEELNLYKGWIHIMR